MTPAHTATHPAAYANEFLRYYEAGKQRSPEGSVIPSGADPLTPAQKAAAYNAGMNDAAVGETAGTQKAEIGEVAQRYINKAVTAQNKYIDKGVEGYTNRFADSAGDIGKVITEIKYIPSSGALLKANPNKTTTVLGSFDRDMKNIVNEMGNVKSAYFGAKKGGFNVLNVPDDMYKSANQFWDEVNVKWLDEAIARGDDFILATKPTTDVLWKIDPVSRTKTLTGFGREYQHMLDNGYVYNSLSNMMVKK